MTELKLKHIYDNYTSETQAAELAKIGVPVDTADCYIDGSGNRYVRSQNEGELDDNFFSETDGYGYVPCWSAGRLIEIWLRCNNALFSVPLTLCIDRHTEDLVSLMINMLYKQKKEGTNFAILKSYE